MTLKKTIFTIITLLTAFAASAADNASQVLDKAAGKFRNAKSVTAVYSIASAQGSTTGTLTLAGNKFAMTGPQLNIWFDGKNQWNYLPADNEVNLSEPTQQELQQVNPLLIISNFSKNYTAKTISTTKTAQKISLTAKDNKAEVRSATVTINPTTYLPSEITLKMASGQSATIRISSVKFGNALPLSTFQFPKAKYPKAEVIDLR